MVIDYSQNKIFKTVGTEIIPIIPERCEAPFRFNFLIPKRSFAPFGKCRRIFAVLPKTGLGKDADDFGLMENAARQHNNYNGSLVNLEMSVISKCFKSNHTSPVRHSENPDIRSEFSKNDSREAYLKFRFMMLNRRYFSMIFSNHCLIFASFKPSLRFFKVILRCSKVLLLCRKMTLLHRKMIF
jgi:hypothetical protein